MNETLGQKLRRARRRLGLTLDELATRSGISKPYLSLIETDRTMNPPTDGKLKKLELVLGFRSNDLVAMGHLLRTPQDVRLMLQKLMEQRHEQRILAGEVHPNTATPELRDQRLTEGVADQMSEVKKRGAGPMDLDAALLAGVLRDAAESGSGNVQQVSTNVVPIINRVSAGYPKDFTDMEYPRGVADDYVSCPDLRDENAFAARVCGDSMMPKYKEGDIVVFSPALSARNGDDCFVRFDDGQTTFKRAFFETDETGRAVVRLQARNEKYRPQSIPTERVTGLYKAYYRFERVDD